MASICFILALLSAPGAAQKPAPSFSNLIQIPVNLYSPEGVRLAKGQYNVEVKQDNGQYTIVFLQNDKAISTVKGEVPKDNAGEPPTTLPLIGTQYLRSSDDPVGTEAERHFSKSGLPRYEEEMRPWKAALRVYPLTDQKTVLWLFEEKLPAGKRSHVEFKLYLSPQ